MAMGKTSIRETSTGFGDEKYGSEKYIFITKRMETDKTG